MADSENSSDQDKDSSNAIFSLQQLDDQSMTTVATKDLTSINSLHHLNPSQPFNPPVVWRDIRFCQDSHQPIQLQQGSLPDDTSVSEETANSRGQYIKLQHKHTGEQKITREGLVFLALHQDFQPVLWQRSPEEKEFVMHARANPNQPFNLSKQLSSKKNSEFFPTSLRFLQKWRAPLQTNQY